MEHLKKVVSDTQKHSNYFRCDFDTFRERIVSYAQELHDQVIECTRVIEAFDKHIENIKDGENGKDGQDASINGFNTVEIQAGDNIEITQRGNKLIIKGLTDSRLFNYNNLNNLPQINGVQLKNNKTLTELGIAANDDIPDVSNFITNAVNNLLNYYLKSETYTKDEVAALIGAIVQFHYEVQPTTEAVTNPQNNVLYLIGPIGEGADKYEEYVYPESINDWVKIGDTSIDLSGYVTTDSITDVIRYSSQTLSDDQKLQVRNNIGATTSEVFWAKYGTTTASEIDAAISAGKTIVCIDATVNKLYAVLTGKDSSTYQFTKVSSSGRIEIWTCRINNSSWDKLVFNAELTSNKVTSLSSASTDTQYPSAKCVYDALPIFWAIYGTTTAAEIDAAVAAGKLVVVKVAYNASIENILYYTNFNNSANPYFSCVSDNIVYYAICNRTSGTWSNTRIFIQAQYDKVSTIVGNETSTTKYPNTKAVADAIGKWGVVSQTQTWSGTGTQPRTYVMSDLVYGTIPQANIDLFESAGATFNATSGYFELNGLMDISYEEMKDIYTKYDLVPTVNTSNGGWAPNSYNYRSKITARTTPNRHCTNTGYYIPTFGWNACIETIGFCINDFPESLRTLKLNGATITFYNAKRLRVIYDIIDAGNSNGDTLFKYCYSLETLYFKNIAKDVYFEASSLLSLPSIVYMVEKAINTTAITITLHATAYARCQADTTQYTHNSNTYTGIIAYATAKNITIQSA